MIKKTKNQHYHSVETIVVVSKMAMKKMKLLSATDKVSKKFEDNLAKKFLKQIITERRFYLVFEKNVSTSTEKLI